MLRKGGTPHSASSGLVAHTSLLIRYREGISCGIVRVSLLAPGQREQTSPSSEQASQLTERLRTALPKNQSKICHSKKRDLHYKAIEAPLVSVAFDLPAEVGRTLCLDILKPLLTVA